MILQILIYVVTAACLTISIPFSCSLEPTSYAILEILEDNLLSSFFQYTS